MLNVNKILKIKLLLGIAALGAFTACSNYTITNMNSMVLDTSQDGEEGTEHVDHDFVVIEKKDAIGDTITKDTKDSDFVLVIKNGNNRNNGNAGNDSNDEGNTYEFVITGDREM